MIFQQKTFSKPSELTHGWHPAYLLRVQEEPKPDYFTKSRHDTAWAWYLAIWQKTADVSEGTPEEHTTHTSPIFSAGGSVIKVEGKDITIPPTKSYEWMSSLLNRAIGKMEAMQSPEGLPCRVMVTREEGKDYIRIQNFAPWEEAPTEWPASIAKLMGNPPVPYLAETASAGVEDTSDIPF